MFARTPRPARECAEYDADRGTFRSRYRRRDIFPAELTEVGIPHGRIVSFFFFFVSPIYRFRTLPKRNVVSAVPVLPSLHFTRT